jgi:hypothetical protein
MPRILPADLAAPRQRFNSVWLAFRLGFCRSPSDRNCGEHLSDGVIGSTTQDVLWLATESGRNLYLAWR